MSHMTELPLPPGIKPMGTICVSEGRQFKSHSGDIFVFGAVQRAHTPTSGGHVWGSKGEHRKAFKKSFIGKQGGKS
jgi:hypothetical protein